MFAQQDKQINSQKSHMRSRAYGLHVVQRMKTACQFNLLYDLICYTCAGATPFRPFTNISRSNVHAIVYLLCALSRKRRRHANFLFNTLQRIYQHRPGCAQDKNDERILSKSSLSCPARHSRLLFATRCWEGGGGGFHLSRQKNPGEVRYGTVRYSGRKRRRTTPHGIDLETNPISPPAR